jgi:hypothetical protein
MDFSFLEDPYNEIFRYNRILETTSKTVAYPHKTITSNDRYRAIALITFLSNDEEMIEYIYSQLTEDDFKAIKQIRNSIYDKEVSD